MKTEKEITEALADLPGGFTPHGLVEARALQFFESPEDGGFMMPAKDARRLGAALIEAADWLDARAEQAKKENTK